MEPKAFDAVAALSASSRSAVTRRRARDLRQKKKAKAAAAAAGGAGNASSTVACSAGSSGAAAAAVGSKRRRAVVDSDSDGDDTAEASGTSSASAAAAGASKTTGQLVQLSRLTVVADTPRSCADLFLGSPVLRSFDLVAVTPGDVDVLRHALASGVADIIRLDVSAGRLPFPLRADVVSSVLAAGAVFEVEYAPAIRDATRRRFFASNVAELLRLTRGRGVLLTSAAAAALELRRPADAAALAALAGMTPQQAQAAQTEAAAQALRHAEKRLSGGLGSGTSSGAAARARPPAGPLHGAAADAAATAGGAVVHVATAPISLASLALLAPADRKDAAPAHKRSKNGSSGLGAALAADDEGNLMLDGASSDDADEGAARGSGGTAAPTAVARKEKKTAGLAKKADLKAARRNKLASASQRELLAAGATLSLGGAAPSTASAAQPWASTATARGVVAAKANKAKIR